MTQEPDLEKTIESCTRELLEVHERLLEASDNSKELSNEGPIPVLRRRRKELIDKLETLAKLRRAAA